MQFEPTDTASSSKKSKPREKRFVTPAPRPVHTPENKCAGPFRRQANYESVNYKKYP